MSKHSTNQLEFSFGVVSSITCPKLVSCKLLTVELYTMLDQQNP